MTSPEVAAWSKRYDFRWDVFKDDGIYVLCGAGRFLDPTTRPNTLSLLRKGKLVPDGKTILTDLTFFTILKRGQPFEGASAACRSTGVGQRESDDEFWLEAGGRGRF